MKKIYDVVISAPGSEDIIFNDSFTTKKLAEKVIENLKAMNDIPEEATFDVKERNLLTVNDYADAEKKFS